MNEINISNKLLSLVLGCECSFCFINDKNDAIEFTSSNNSNILHKNKYTTIVGITWNWSINLHTFIHLAKIKALDEGYEILHSSIRTKIHNVNTNKKLKSFCYVGAEYFHISNVLFALEWVAEKVGGAG